MCTEAIDAIFTAITAIAGLSALGVYWLQKHARTKNAARMIVLQIQDVRDRMREMTRLVNGSGIDEKAFYEALPIVPDDTAWDRYKHMFASKIDSDSYRSIEQFFSYAKQVQKQQSMVTDLQAAHLNAMNDVFADVEKNFMMSLIWGACNTPCLPQGPFNWFQGPVSDSGVPAPYIGDISVKFKHLQQMFRDSFNASPFTVYTPLQTPESLDRLLRSCSMLEVKGPGYAYLCKKAGL